MGLEKYSDGNYLILLLYEGTAEQEIIDWLLDEDKLLFTRENLVSGKIHRRRSVRKVEKDFLSYDFGEREVVIFRILDSRNVTIQSSGDYLN